MKTLQAFAHLVACFANTLVCCFLNLKRDLGLAATSIAIALLTTIPALAGPPQFSFQVISTLGDPAPGAAGGTFVNDFEPGNITSSGNIAFGADVSTGGEGVFMLRQGRIVELARTGGAAPGGGMYGGGFLGPVMQNDQADIAFVMLLDPPGVPFLGGNAGLYRAPHTTGKPFAVVIPGTTPAPGGGMFQGTNFQPAINNRGDIVFGGLIETANGIHVPGETYIGIGGGLYRADTNGQITKLVAPGDAAPGGGTFDLAWAAWSNDAGDIAFIGHLKGEEAPNPGFPAPQAFQINGIQSLYFMDANGIIRSIAHAGDPSPCGQIRQAANPVINNGGDIAFNGDLTPPPGAGLIVGVFLSSHGQITKVACPGDPMPGGGRLASAIITGGNIHLNNRSDVVFSGVLNTGETGIYQWSHGSLSVIARSGTVLALADGVKTIDFLGSAIQPSFAVNNDRGQVLFQATLTDGSVVFLQATPSDSK